MKPATAKASGRETENRWASFLSLVWSGIGWKVERRRMKGAKDQGDLVGVPGWTLESKKSLAALNLALNQAAKEAVNAGTYWYAGLLRRRGVSYEGDWAVVMVAKQWARLVMEHYQLRVQNLSLVRENRGLREELARRRD